MSEKFNGKMETLDLEEMEKVNGGVGLVFCDEYFAYVDFIDSMWAKYGKAHGSWLDDLLPQLSWEEYLKAVDLYNAYLRAAA